MEELSALFLARVLRDMCETAIADPHSFWCVNLVSNDKSEMFYVRVDHDIVVE